MDDYHNFVEMEIISTILNIPVITLPLQIRLRFIHENNAFSIQRTKPRCVFDNGLTLALRASKEIN